VSSQPRITADFNSGGRDGDRGVVYLGPDTLSELERTGVKLRSGMQLTLSDYDGTEDEPLWLVATGVLNLTDDLRWKLVYEWHSTWHEPRTTD
jgi:hypothetical protein